MQWSQLKKQIENTFADSVRGHVEVWNTRYRGAHDQAGEVWITIDKVRVQSIAECTWGQDVNQEAKRLRIARQGKDFTWEEHPDEYLNSYAEARETAPDREVLTPTFFLSAISDYLVMSFDDIMVSDNPIIEAFGMLDKRLGKRRMQTLKVRSKHPLVRTLFEYRCSSEGIRGESA
jgi:hypothetical protein